NATQRNKIGVGFVVAIISLTSTGFANSTNSTSANAGNFQEYDYSSISQTVPVSAPITDISQLTKKDQYGCSAYLCFAGGFAYPECQQVIRKVTRDLIRGKSFPTCSALSNSDGSVGGQNGSPRIFTQKTRKYIKIMKQNADGSVEQISSVKRRKF
ncbi:hypothetical protein, partial [Moraxella equi]